MDKVFIAAVGILAGLTAMPAVAAPAYSWAGCYVGGNFGGGTAYKSWADFGPPMVSLGDNKASGLIGGGQAGCNFQTGTLVIGARGVFEAGSLRDNHLGFEDALGSKSSGIIIGPEGVIGIAPTDSLLIYVTGGAAFVDDRHRVVDPTTLLIESTARTTREGYGLGAGVAYMLFPNVSIFAEYNHLNFGARRVSFINFEVPPVPPVFPLRIRQTVETGIVGINYRFWGWPN